MIVLKHKFHFLFPVFLLIGLLNCQNSYIHKTDEPEKTILQEIYESGAIWADSVFNSLNDDEKIAQLFWLAIENGDNPSSRSEMLKLVKAYKPGGILLFKTDPLVAFDIIDDFQANSKVPLLVSIDGEWGPAMRFPGVLPFPYAVSLGAITNDSLIYFMGLEIARQLRLMGIHINMAPVADVNSNRENPVIGFRSFGERPENVAKKSVAYMQGLQNGNIMAVGKHFPGHGDTKTDSHKTLPLVAHNWERLNSVELLPFRSLINEGIWAIMTTHIEVPALDTIPGIPFSFSKSAIRALLRDSMNFKGLVVTDAINMQGAKIMGQPGEIDALALAAGNDIVEFTENLPAAIQAVKNAIDEGRLSWEQIEIKCKRSLAFKHWLVKKHSCKRPPADSLLVKINTDHTKLLIQNLYKAALTLVADNEELLLPKKLLQQETVFIFDSETAGLKSKIQDEFNSPTYDFSTVVNEEVFSSLSNYKNLILIVADTQWDKMAIPKSVKDEILSLMKEKKALLVYMANPYSLSNWKAFKSSTAFLLAYQNNEYSEDAIIDYLKGNILSSGQLPVSVQYMFNAGEGFLNRGLKIH